MPDTHISVDSLIELLAELDVSFKETKTKTGCRSVVPKSAKDWKAENAKSYKELPYCQEAKGVRQAYSLYIRRFAEMVNTVVAEGVCNDACSKGARLSQTKTGRVSVSFVDSRSHKAWQPLSEPKKRSGKRAKKPSQSQLQEVLGSLEGKERETADDLMSRGQIVDLTTLLTNVWRERMAA